MCVFNVFFLVCGKSGCLERGCLFFFFGGWLIEKHACLLLEKGEQQGREMIDIIICYIHIRIFNIEPCMAEIRRVNAFNIMFAANIS